MSISTLQRSAFVRSNEFVEQVNGVVSEQALGRHDTWGNLDAQTRTALGQVACNPNTYGFAQTIVNDSTWGVTYDQWAMDPPAAKDEIMERVEKYWLLLTGIAQPPPIPPE